MEANFNMKARTLSEIFPDLESGFIVYCGAGISIPAPTCSPSWWTLTIEVLKAFFDHVPEEYELPKDMIFKDELFSPESIFEIFSRVIDKDFLKIFDVLDVTEPNANHQLIARLAKAKILKACFTTNFDVYIERALKKEGIEYDLLVDNSDYDVYFENMVNNDKMSDKFLLCKIHGTLELPDSIIAVASAYKSLKGFSPSKSKLFKWLLEKYSCLFLGYSGWDFEHINYRKFWDRAGPDLKSIYWNRRLGEVGGPKFPLIFNSCKKKFSFSEAELPEGWISALKDLNLAQIDEVGLTVVDKTNNDRLWDEAEIKRRNFLVDWASKIPEATVLGAIIAEAVHFTAKFKEFQTQAVEASKNQPSSLEDNAKLQVEMQNLGQKFSKQEISSEKYTKRINELQIEMNLVAIEASKKARIYQILEENRYPGVTDNPVGKMQLIPKVAMLCRNFEVDEAFKIAFDFYNSEKSAMTKGGNIYLAEMTTNLWLQTNMVPDEKIWKPEYEKLCIIKEKFVNGSIDQEKFNQEIASLTEKAQNAKMGMNMPWEMWINKLIEIISSSKTKEELITGCEALNIALIGIYSKLNADLLKSDEFKALNSAANKNLETAASSQYDQAFYQQKMADLAKMMGEKKITAVEYQQQAQDAFQEAQKRMQDPQDQKIPEIPQETLVKYDLIVRRKFIPVLEKINEVFGEGYSYARSLVEMIILSLWIAGTQMMFVEESKNYYKDYNDGNYPLVKSHPDIVSFLYEKNIDWINKGLQDLPKRFGHTLGRFAVELAEMAGDMELCEKATLKCLEYEEGKVTEATFMKIPLTLAAFFEKKGDKENALKYYEKGFEALTTSFIPPYADNIVYKTAFFLSEKGDKNKAMKILGLGFPEFYGNDPPLKTPARGIGLKLAEKIAIELGYSDAHTAMSEIFK